MAATAVLLALSCFGMTTRFPASVFQPPLPSQSDRPSLSLESSQQDLWDQMGAETSSPAIEFPTCCSPVRTADMADAHCKHDKHIRTLRKHTTNTRCKLGEGESRTLHRCRLNEPPCCSPKGLLDGGLRQALRFAFTAERFQVFIGNSRSGLHRSPIVPHRSHCAPHLALSPAFPGLGLLVKSTTSMLHLPRSSQSLPTRNASQSITSGLQALGGGMCILKVSCQEQLVRRSLARRFAKMHKEIVAIQALCT